MPRERNAVLILDYLASVFSWLMSLFQTRQRVRPRRRRGNALPPVAADVLLLERRWLLSASGVGGEHHAAPLAQPAGKDVIRFAGYKRDANDHSSGDGGHHDHGQQQTLQNALVKNGRLHLMMKDAAVGGNSTALSSTRVVLAGDSFEQPFHPGYRTYQVSARTAGGVKRLASSPALFRCLLVREVPRHRRRRGQHDYQAISVRDRPAQAPDGGGRHERPG